MNMHDPMMIPHKFPYWASRVVDEERAAARRVCPPDLWPALQLNDEPEWLPPRTRDHRAHA